MSGVPAEATPERLTAVLRRAGVLTRGEVVDVAVETSRDTLISRIARLRLTYAQGDDAGPSHVFFKTSREDAAEALRELGRKEVTFYDVVAVATPPGLLPRCYEAAAEPAGRWHVMLEDLTALTSRSASGRCRLPWSGGTRSSRPMPGSTRSGGTTSVWASRWARSRTIPVRSTAISRHSRRIWPSSPIAWATVEDGQILRECRE